MHRKLHLLVLDKNFDTIILILVPVLSQLLFSIVGLLAQVLSRYLKKEFVQSHG